jgi:hypothetical protein
LSDETHVYKEEYGQTNGYEYRIILDVLYSAAAAAPYDDDDDE